MALASRALRIALDYRAELGPGVPIVFAAVDSVGDLTLPREVTGVLMIPDWMDTLGAALRLQPETRRVVVVSGTSALEIGRRVGKRCSGRGHPALVAYLQKPFREDALIGAIQQALEGRRA